MTESALRIARDRDEEPDNSLRELLWFPGGVFVGFERVWGFWAPPGGVSEAVRSRGSFWSILGVILRLILGPFWSVFLVYYVRTSLH